MPGWWSANDFRHARMVLIGVSMGSWVPILYVGRFTPLLVGLLHLGLLASLGLERRGGLERGLGAMLLLPSSMVAAVFAMYTLVSVAHGNATPGAATALLFALAHAAQLWRLVGLPIPPLHPIAAPVTDDSFFHPQAAPEQSAERIAGR